MTEPADVIVIRFTTQDIESMAEVAGVDLDTALARALDWGKYIADAATELCTEQLMSVIEHDQP